MHNDPEFTAYALGELDDKAKNQFLARLKAAGHPIEEIEENAEQIRAVGGKLNEEFRKDETIRLAVEQREKVLETKPKKNWFYRISLIGGVPAAAVIAFMIYNQHEFSSREKLSQSLTPNKVDEKAETVFSDSTMGEAEADMDFTSSGAKEVQATGKLKLSKKIARRRVAPQKPSVLAKGGAPEGLGMVREESYIHPVPTPPIIESKREQFNREAYDKIETNKYTLVLNQPLSTFSVDVDTASYANMRRYLLQGNLPPKDSIRVEELVNYFNYEYKMDFKKHPVAINVDQSWSPWTKGRKIVRVALKSDSPSKLMEARKNLVFLMDVSGSMSNAKKLPLLKESMRLLVRKLKKSDTISLVVYAGASGVVLEPTPVSEKLKIFKALDNLSAGGSTNAGAGINAAYSMAKKAFIKDGVNRVILATDGDFNVGTTSQSALVDLVAEKAKDDIFLTVIGLGMGNYQDSMLEQLSNKGNGNYAYIDSLSEANKLFNVDLEKNLTTVAKDVKVQIEFNPAKVAAYRLIGYENRMLAAQDFNDDKKDAGEMGAGHNVTAIYEVIPAGVKTDIPEVDKLKYAKKVKVDNDSNDLLTVKVRYKQPTETKSVKFDVVLKDKEQTFKSRDTEFRFATAVASFGMKLRNDDLADNLTYRDIEKMAKSARGEDRYDFREEFIELIDLARQIDK